MVTRTWLDCYNQGCSWWARLWWCSRPSCWGDRPSNGEQNLSWVFICFFRWSCTQYAVETKEKL